MSIDFSRKLIKGRIVEVIFEQMIREEGRYTVIPFGYEHTTPTLAQFRTHFPAEVEKVIQNISEAPDFALISEDKKELFLVEVKYQKKLDFGQIKDCAGKLMKRWESPWVFVATSEAFYCAPCRSVVNNEKIGLLSENWINKDRQIDFLKLLNEFLS